jgi:hypothetical protein
MNLIITKTMKTDEGIYYKKVFIESESDLPKEKGIYLFSRRNERFYLYKPFDPESKNSDPQGWVNLFDWYLIPLPANERTAIKPTINDYPSTDSRTFINLDYTINWQKYANALDMYISELSQFQGRDKAVIKKQHDYIDWLEREVRYIPTTVRMDYIPKQIMEVIMKCESELSSLQSATMHDLNNADQAEEEKTTLRLNPEKCNCNFERIVSQGICGFCGKPI